MPSRKGQKGKAANHNLTEIRHQELAISQQAEDAYRRLVADSQANKPSRRRRNRCPDLTLSSVVYMTRADFGFEGHERDHVLPAVAPRLGDHGDPLAPFLVERVERRASPDRRRSRCR